MQAIQVMVVIQYVVGHMLGDIILFFYIERCNCISLCIIVFEEAQNSLLIFNAMS